MVNTNFPRTPEEQKRAQNGSLREKARANGALRRGMTPEGSNPQNRQGEAFSNTKGREGYLGMNKGRYEVPDQTPGLTAMEDAYNNRMRAIAEEEFVDEEGVPSSSPEESENNRQVEIAAKQAEFRAREETREDEENEYQDRLYEQQMNQTMEENVRQKMFKDRQLAEEQAKKREVQVGLDTTWFIVSLIIAITLDIIGFAVSFIPAFGEGVSSFIIMPIGICILWMIHLVNGVKFDTKTKLRFFGFSLFELIPFVNMLPGLTTLVLMSKAKPLIEKQAGKLGGMVGGEDGAKIASTVTKQINK